MYNELTTRGRGIGITTMAAALMFGAALAWAGDSEPDASMTSWLGHEFTVESSTSKEHMPVGGKLTFIFDASDNVVRICTRSVPTQVGAWRMDFAVPCNVALTFTRGTRYCSAEDVKAGNAEVLSTCHRLRSHDVAMHPSAVKGAVELNDMIAFLVRDADGRPGFIILVDSPARVTESGVIKVGPQ